jgi:copper oxidase (laccase) domain-containing protein
MTAAVGPCIAQASYEVGPELRQMFMADDPSASDLFRPVAGSDRLLLDLERHVLGRLGRAGVSDTCGLAEDTHADPARFFSARRTRQAGGDRFGLLLSAIGLA